MFLYPPQFDFKTVKVHRGVKAAAGVTLECVDYRNYEAVNDIIREFE